MKKGIKSNNILLISVIKDLNKEAPELKELVTKKLKDKELNKEN